MFSHRSRPLYHLCNLMTIDRIATPCYRLFISDLANKKWGRKLEGGVIDAIVELTENHPYYVNVLCRNLWKKEALPTIASVRSSWDDYVAQQSAWIMSDLSGLTINRRRVLQLLVTTPTSQPQSALFVSKLAMSAASVKQSIDALLKVDLICRDHEGVYQVLDPALQYFIQNF